MNNNVERFVIIAGTEKSGTTSLYQYLYDSGCFNVSLKKETDYLRNQEVSLQGYLKEFSSKENSNFYLEASPGYLADSYLASTNLRKIVGDNCYLIFLLRSPMARLRSSFLFHKSRLFLPKQMNFDEYISLCMSYNQGVSASDLGLAEWFLRVPDSGLYYKHLSDYLAQGYKKFKVFTFEEFREAPSTVVLDIISDLEFDGSVYESYTYGRSNITQSYKSTLLQRVALSFNSYLEPFFFRNPRLKERLMSIYFALNGREKETISCSKEVRLELYQYYAKDINSLVKAEMIPERIGKDWLAEFT